MARILIICILSFMLTLWLPPATAKTIRYEDLEHLTRDQVVHKLIAKLQKIDHSFLAKGTQAQRISSEQSFSEILLEYGKYLLYGEPMAKIREALFFFKLSSSFGNPQAFYYLALFQEHQIDGMLQLKWNVNLMLSSALTPEKLKNIKYLQHYLDRYHLRESHLHLYLSSLQGYKKASLALGNRYYSGYGVETNCSTAFLYLNDVGREMVREGVYSLPLMTERRKLPEELFDKDYNPDFIRKREEEEISFLESQLHKDSPNHVRELGEYYYYGLKGIKQNLTYAFELFSHASYLGDTIAKTRLGYMYLYGQGIPKDYRKAYDHFNAAVLKNDKSAKNGLGIMYKLGLVVKPDRKQARKWFQSAAESLDNDGLYNYAAEYLEDHLKEQDLTSFNKGYNYLMEAAQRGHLLSSYNMALIYFDGVGNIYSCELALQSIRHATQRTKWSKHLKDGFRQFVNHNYLRAAIFFLDAAMLGYDVGQVNGAFILDRKKPIGDDMLDYSKLDQVVSSDPIYQWLHGHSRIYSGNFAKRAPLEIMYSDILQALESFDIQEKTVLVRQWLVPVNETRASNEYIAFKLYKSAAEENLDAFSTLRLGDYYYYGVGGIEPNIHKAIKYYNRTTQVPKSDAYFVSQAYFNLGYIYHYGVANITRNLTLAEALYHKAIELNTNMLVTIKPLLLLLRYDKLTSPDGNKTAGYAAVTSSLADLTKSIYQDYKPVIKGLLVMLSGGLLIVFVGLRLYYKNLANFRPT